MAVLIIYGMPETAGEPTIFLEAFLPEITASLQSGVGKDLDVSPSSVSVFFPTDRMTSGLGEELICFVDGLFEKPELTPSLCQGLASNIVFNLGLFALHHIPQCEEVKVIIRRFNQEVDVFSVWKKSKR